MTRTDPNIADAPKAINVPFDRIEFICDQTRNLEIDHRRDDEVVADMMRQMMKEMPYKVPYLMAHGIQFDITHEIDGPEWTKHDLTIRHHRLRIKSHNLVGIEWHENDPYIVEVIDKYVDYSRTAIVRTYTRPNGWNEQTCPVFGNRVSFPVFPEMVRYATRKDVTKG